MPSSHLILCRPLLLLPPIPPSIRVFSNESTLLMRWLKYWSFSFSITPSKEIPGLISFRMDWLDLLAVQGTLKSLLQHHSSKASIGGVKSEIYWGPCHAQLGVDHEGEREISPVRSSDEGEGRKGKVQVFLNSSCNRGPCTSLFHLRFWFVFHITWASLGRRTFSTPSSTCSS